MLDVINPLQAILMQPIVFIKGALQFLADHNVFDNEGNPCHSALQITSEYKRGNETFRAHRNYRNNGPWYAWVMFR
jgi:hypothetical protein